MPTMVVTFTAGEGARIVAALSARYGYSPVLMDGAANPQTAGEFARQQVLRWLVSEVRAYERDQAAEAITSVGVT